MNLEKVSESSNSIYDSFKDDVCEKCKVKIQERLNKLSKLQMTLLITRPKLIPKKLGICQGCINKIHRKLLKNARSK